MIWLLLSCFSISGLVFSLIYLDPMNSVKQNMGLVALTMLSTLATIGSIFEFSAELYPPSPQDNLLLEVLKSEADLEVIEDRDIGRLKVMKDGVVLFPKDRYPKSLEYLNKIQQEKYEAAAKLEEAQRRKILEEILLTPKNEVDKRLN